MEQFLTSVGHDDQTGTLLTQPSVGTTVPQTEHKGERALITPTKLMTEQEQSAITEGWSECVCVCVRVCVCVGVCVWCAGVTNTHNALLLFSLCTVSMRIPVYHLHY